MMKVYLPRRDNSNFDARPGHYGKKNERLDPATRCLARRPLHRHGYTQQALVVAEKAEWLRNFHRSTLHAPKERVKAAGLCHPSEVNAHHIVRRRSCSAISSCRWRQARCCARWRVRTGFRPTPDGGWRTG
jgi:hypothetical protein